MAGLAVDPGQIVSELSDPIRQLDTEPPGLLGRPVDGSPPPPPIRESAELSAVHEGWVRVHAGDDRSGGAQTGLRAQARQRLASLAADAVGKDQRDDRALIGSLIRAVDALAQRNDELSGRLAQLETLVGEVIDVLGRDLTVVRAVLDDLPHTGAGVAPPPPPVGQPPTSTEPGTAGVDG